MRQAIMTKPGIIAFNDVAAPRKLAPNEVLLKIQKIGVCGSDIHVFHGVHPATTYPVVQGFSMFHLKLEHIQMQRIIFCMACYY